MIPKRGEKSLTNKPTDAQRAELRMLRDRATTEYEKGNRSAAGKCLREARRILLAVNDRDPGTAIDWRLDLANPVKDEFADWSSFLFDWEHAMGAQGEVDRLLREAKKS